MTFWQKKNLVWLITFTCWFVIYIFTLEIFLFFFSCSCSHLHLQTKLVRCRLLDNPLLIPYLFESFTHPQLIVATKNPPTSNVSSVENSPISLSVIRSPLRSVLRNNIPPRSTWSEQIRLTHKVSSSNVWVGLESGERNHKNGTNETSLYEKWDRNLKLHFVQLNELIWQSNTFY